MSGGIPKRIQIAKTQTNTHCKSGGWGKSEIVLCGGRPTALCNFIQRRTNQLTIKPSSSCPPDPIIPTPPAPFLPVQDLKILYDIVLQTKVLQTNVLQTNPRYNLQYKPTFTWTFPQNTKDNIARMPITDVYLKYILSTWEDPGYWVPTQHITQRHASTSTPSGTGTNNPFQFLRVDTRYRIEIVTAIHPESGGEETVGSFLEFGPHNPYPIPLIPNIHTPDAPLGLSGSGGQYRVNLHWDIPNSGGSLITFYYIQQASVGGDGSPGKFTTVSATGNRHIYISDLKDDTDYYFKVAAANIVGTGEFTDPIKVRTGPSPVRVPGVPRDLEATGNRREVYLTWNKPVHNGGKVINGYQLQSKTAEGNTWSNEGGVQDNLYKIVSGLNDSTTYYFKVAAKNSEGFGLYTTDVSGTTSPPIPPRKPSRPYLRSVTPGPAEATLIWETPADIGTSAITNYKVEQSLDGGSPWSIVDTLLPTNHPPTVTIIELTPNTSYWYRVSATNAGGYGEPSKPPLFVTPTQPPSVPSKPRDLTVAGGSQQITVSWTPPSTLGGSSITDYSVDISGISQPVQTFHTATNQITITDIAGVPLGAHTVYYVKVAATNFTGTGPFTHPLQSAKTNTVPMAPGTPTLTATGMKDEIKLTWYPPTNTGGDFVSSYFLQRSTTNSGPWDLSENVLPSEPQAAINYYDASMNAGINTFYYRVAATNSIGQGPYSTVVHATTLAHATKPKAPTLDSLQPGIKELMLKWEAGPNGGSQIINYNVQYSKSAGFQDASLSTTTATTLTITDLSGSTPYWVKVSETNIKGDSPWSNVQTATTSAGGNCDSTCSGTVEEWNGSTSQTSHTIPDGAALQDKSAFGAKIYWDSTGLTYGIQKPAGPGCVDFWKLEVYKGSGLVATYNQVVPVNKPRTIYIINSPEGTHGKYSDAFIIPALKSGTSYVLKCVAQPIAGACSNPLPLNINFTTGVPAKPQPPQDCDPNCSGSEPQWNGTITNIIPKNGVDPDFKKHVGCEINWTHIGLKYAACVSGWMVKIFHSNEAQTLIGTKTFSAAQKINITNYSSGNSDWCIEKLIAGYPYYIRVEPIRNPQSGCQNPPKIGSPFHMGIAYSPGPDPPSPCTGNFPQTYVTTYGTPSWGKTGLQSSLSQLFFSNGTSLTSSSKPDKLSTEYNQHQCWAMVRAWAHQFFQTYIGFIAENTEITNAMILIGDWAPVLPGAGLPVQASTLDAKLNVHGQVAGSQVAWSIQKANYSYCSPNGPVDFGLSYNQNTTTAPPPPGLTGGWWGDDSDMIGCPLILDFLIPLARKLHGRVVEISVNGDVGKNGNDGSYYSLDCGNYTSADQRLLPSDDVRTATLHCILKGQTWVKDIMHPPPNWGPLGDNKTQTVQFSITHLDYMALISGAGAPSKPISQNNQGANSIHGTKGTVASSTWSGGKATFTVNIKMSEGVGVGDRTDGGFTITNPSPALNHRQHLHTLRGNAKIYFADPSGQTLDGSSNPTGVGRLYPVLNTDPSIGIFMQNWVIQQSDSAGAFPPDNSLLEHSTTGGIIGQISETLVESWTKYDGAVKVGITLGKKVLSSYIKPYLISTDPSTYDTQYKHRIYPVPGTWDPNKDGIPPPPTNLLKFHNIRIGSVDTKGKVRALPALYNYSTLDLSSSRPYGGGATRRALGDGPGNSSQGDGGWLPSDWKNKKGYAYYPSYWNVAPVSKHFPKQPDDLEASGNSFDDINSLIMGGGGVFIGNGTGSFCGRGTYFDPNTVADASSRPGLITLSDGKKGTYFSYDKTDPGSGRIGFPLDNLHQLYILIYHINQKIMKFNWVHSTKNGYSPSGKDANMTVSLISHVHHDKESYQVNKYPHYPICDSTGEISADWLRLGNSATEIKNMSASEFRVWKRSRHQTSVAYEKYLYNRYMPAEYLPDWRAHFGIPDAKHHLPHNTGCFIPNTGDKSPDGLTQTNAEPMWDWDSNKKPWNESQQRNFGKEPDPHATVNDSSGGIGNYSNDFSRKGLDNAHRDGIQRYNMGWVNYAVTAWAYGPVYAGPQKIKCPALLNSIPKDSLVEQVASGATGRIVATANVGNTSFYIMVLQGIFITPNTKIPPANIPPANIQLTVYVGGQPVNINITKMVPPSTNFTSQGINEAYQELYNIGEVKPPVNHKWVFNSLTTDSAGKSKQPTPNIGIEDSDDLASYVNGTVSGFSGTKPISAPILSIYKKSHIVLGASATLEYPDMFTVYNDKSKKTVTLINKDKTKKKVTRIKTVYAINKGVPFPANFILLNDPTNKNKKLANEYGTGEFKLPGPKSKIMIPNGLGSASIPGGTAPSCNPDGGIANFCPVGPKSKKVGPYYKLNAVTNTLIGRIFNKYGVSDEYPFLGTNSVNPIGTSPALTDLWLRFDAINTGVIPLDGRGFKPSFPYNTTPYNAHPAINGPQSTDGTFAPFQSPWVNKNGQINLTNLYQNVQKSSLDLSNVILPSFVPPHGPRQAIALFANEYIGGALTLDPTARPGTVASKWYPVIKGANSSGTLGPDYLPGTIQSWVGSRGMEVLVYSDLIKNLVNKNFKNVTTGENIIAPSGESVGVDNRLFTIQKWKDGIQTTDKDQIEIFKETGWSFEANNWGGEYNGLSALQDNTHGYKHMKNFLRSSASMQTGLDYIGCARVGLYTIGFIPETWLKGDTF